jgi:hypothetical protein
MHPLLCVLLKPSFQSSHHSSHSIGLRPTVAVESTSEQHPLVVRTPVETGSLSSRLRLFRNKELGMKTLFSAVSESNPFAASTQKSE